MSNQKLAKELEFYQTPEWCIRAILNRETFPKLIVDPCCGKLRIGNVLREHHHDIIEIDIHNWLKTHMIHKGDFLCDPDIEELLKIHKPECYLMNPPFSKACDFVDRAIELGAKKIVSFQRMAWYESETRRQWWDNAPLSRIYMCGNRATCWRGDLEQDEKGFYLNPETKKPMSNTPTSHAWFIFEPHSPQGCLIDRIYKDE